MGLNGNDENILDILQDLLFKTIIFTNLCCLNSSLIWCLLSFFYRAILCPTFEFVEQANEFILYLVSGKKK